MVALIPARSYRLLKTTHLKVCQVQGQAAGRQLWDHAARGVDTEHRQCLGLRFSDGGLSRGDGKVARREGDEFYPNQWHGDK